MINFRASYALALIALIGCNPNSFTAVQDSWAHYENGGMFYTQPPSLTADRSRLAYATPCSGHGDIYLIGRGSNVPLRLTSDPAFESSPLISPDGTFVVFAREDAGHRHLWRVGADGTGLQRITSGSGFDEPLSLSSDGSTLLFCRSTPSLGMGMPASARLVAMGDFSSTKEVGDVAIVPPGCDFAIFANTAEDRLYRLDLQSPTGTPTPIWGTGIPLDATSDGAAILVARWASTSNPSYQIWLLDSRRQSEQFVANGDCACFVDNNGQTIVYFSGYDGMARIWSADGAQHDPIPLGKGHRSSARLLCDRQGLLVMMFQGTGLPDYRTLLIDFESRTCREIATSSCGNANYSGASDRRE